MQKSQKKLVNQVNNVEPIQNQETKDLTLILRTALISGIFVLIISILSILGFIEMKYANRNPLNNFTLVDDSTKVLFSNGILQDSFVKIKLTKNQLIINEDTIDIKYQYWYYGKPHILAWEGKNIMIQYKCVGFTKPHSLDIYYTRDSVMVNEQWVF